jgi:hypothetical protein
MTKIELIRLLYDALRLRKARKFLDAEESEKAK